MVAILVDSTLPPRKLAVLSILPLFRSNCTKIPKTEAPNLILKLLFLSEDRFRPGIHLFEVFLSFLLLLGYLGVLDITRALLSQEKKP